MLGASVEVSETCLLVKLLVHRDAVMLAKNDVFSSYYMYITLALERVSLANL